MENRLQSRTIQKAIKQRMNFQYAVTFNELALEKKNNNNNRTWFCGTGNKLVPRNAADVNTTALATNSEE